MLRRTEAERLLRDLGLTPADFQAVRLARTREDAEARFSVLKEKIRVGFRRLSFELHPDRTGNDPEKTERFKQLIELKAELDKLQLPVQRPVPAANVRRVVVVNYYNGPFTTATTTHSHARPSGPPSPGRTQATVTMHPSGVPFVRGR